MVDCEYSCKDGGRFDTVSVELSLHLDLISEDAVLFFPQLGKHTNAAIGSGG